MGLMDTLKGLLGQGKKTVADNQDKINDAVDKGADLADDKTGGKHSDKIDKAADVVKDTVDKVADEGDGQ